MRVWELNENSTRYDAIVAAPSDEALMHYWWTWAVVATMVGIASLILFLGIAFSPKARKNPFNLYLLYLSIPDFIFSLSCGITCLLNAINGEYWAAWMCNFQQWYCVFGIGSNAWLNACVVRELYKMLWFGYNRRRYTSPSLHFVSQQALVVFLFMGFLGTWGVIEAPHWPYHAGAPSGLACLPIEVDHASSLFFWLVFFPLFTGIPSVYIIYVTYRIWRYKLIPPTGKRRLLTVYFGRLIFVFYIMWLPTMILLFVIPSYGPTWVHFLGGLWSHLQGAVSMAVSLMKPDIASAVKHLLLCQCEKEVGNPSHVASHGSELPSGDMSDQKWLSQHSWCANPAHPNGSTELDKGSEQERVSGKSRNSMFSSRDMWPSSTTLDQGSSRFHPRVLAESLSNVVEQLDDDDDDDNNKNKNKDVEEDKDNLSTEVGGDEEVPLHPLQ